MSLNFNGKVAIVTGAGGGLGFVYAKYLAEHGCNVLVNDLGGGAFGIDGKTSSKVAEDAVAQINALGKGEAIANAANVADFDAAKTMVDAAIKQWGRIDIIINNAGIVSTGTFPNIDREEVDLHIGVHYMGAINTIRAAWPFMIEQQFGRIINIASDSLLGFSPQTTYPSMKSALIGLSRNAALMGQEHNIHVNIVLPVAFTRLTAILPESDFRDRLEHEFQPERLAPVVSYLCHDSCDVSGEMFSVGGGKFSRFVLASSAAMPVDMTMESVVAQMDNVMTDNLQDYFIAKTTFDDLTNLGFSEQDYEVFKDVMSVQASAGAIEAVSIDHVDDVWELTIKSPVGDQFNQLVLKSSANQLAGYILNEEHGNQKILDGCIENGNTLLLKCKITKPAPLTLSYRLQKDKYNNLQGTMTGLMMGKSVMEAPVIGFPSSPEAHQAAQQEAARQAELDGQKKQGFFSRLSQFFK